MRKVDFNNLFILDLANNHQGDVGHGLEIIRGVGAVVKKAGIRAALKFQFRNIETMVHPDYRNRTDVPHIPRFLGTALSESDYRRMTAEVRAQGMITMATPFDEDSVGLIDKLDIEIIKVASCSAMDKPLLARIAADSRPVVVSTAGLNQNKIDRLVSFLESRNVNFALMHCVALYPTPKDKLYLNQISLLRERYPQLSVGFSTHERPDNCDAIRIAYAKGAKLFERHVGIGNEKYKLNDYSSNPAQLDTWIAAYKDAVEMCGGEEKPPASREEVDSLQSLMRGVYVKKVVTRGGVIDRESVFLAMPLQQGQLVAGSWRDGIIADRDYAVNEPLGESLAEFGETKEQMIYGIMLQIGGMLNKAKIAVSKNSSVEISHHYGLDRFREFGCVLIDCVNRDYCKKLLVVLPRQKHPYHYHDKKEETFQLLAGDLEIELNGKRTKLEVGDTLLVEPKKWHKFHSLDGAIVEEVSTTHFSDDSFYEDERIARLPREKRKTPVANWATILSGGQ